MYCGVHQLSRGTRAWLRVPRVSNICPSIWARFPGPMGSTRCPGQLAFKSEGPRGRPALPCLSGPGPMVRGINEFSQATRACVRGPAASTSSPGRITLGSRANGVDPWSWATRARALWPAGSTSCPGRLARGSKGSRVRPALLGESRSALRAKGLTHSPGRHGPEPYGLRDRPAAPGDSRPVPRARGFDQISRANRARVCWPVVSTSCPA